MKPCPNQRVRKVERSEKSKKRLKQSQEALNPSKSSFYRGNVEAMKRESKNKGRMEKQYSLEDEKNINDKIFPLLVRCWEIWISCVAHQIKWGI